MTPHPGQREWLRCRARYTLAMCGAQSGKSIAAAPLVAARIARDLAHGPPRPLRYWVVDPTYRLARQAQEYLRDAWGAFGARPAWTSWLGGAGIYSRAQIGRAQIEFMSAERPDMLVSVPVDGLWLNESARIKEGTWEGNLRSRLAATRGWVVADTTPLGENWVYREFYLRGLPHCHPDYDAAAVLDAAPRCSRERQYCAHTWSTADNPAVDPLEVERARSSLPAWAFAREWQGDPHHHAGQLFPHWRTDVNVARRSASDFPAIELACDWGFGSGHPFALLVVGVDLPGRRVHVLEEHVREGMLFDEQVTLIGQVAERYPTVRRLTGDSADPGMLAMARARRVGRHVDVVGASKEPGSVYAGTVAQADLIGTGRYTVDPACVQTIRQHRAARWKPAKGDGEILEEPLRKDDDTVAAMRYLIYPRLARARDRTATR